MVASDRAVSRRCYSQACEVMPGGVNSPVRAFRALNIDPIVVSRGEGSLIYDEDGRRYIDFCCSWGSLLHGHAEEGILAAVRKQLSRGTSYGFTTVIEERLARTIVECVPGVDKIRFTSSGTEAVMTAVRLSRGYMRRSIVVKFDGHYHGHADSLLGDAGSAVLYLAEPVRGVPEETLLHTRVLPFNDVEALLSLMENVGEQVACILLEVVPANMGVVLPQKEFLDALQSCARRFGALLIADEVITGFRIGGLSGAAHFFDIQPDLLTFGKIIGGGFPVGAVGGRREVMDDLAPLGNVFQAGTLSGNPITMSAGYAAIEAAKLPDFYVNLEATSRVFTDRIAKALQKAPVPICMNRIGSLFTLFFGLVKVESKDDLVELDHALFRRFYLYAMEQGVLFSPSPFEAHFISSAHTKEELDYVALMIEEFIMQL